MAHLAFLAPPFLGHLNPMRALADGLVARGHRVTFLLQSDAAPLVGTHGFVPVGIRSHPPGHLAGMLARMARADSPLGLAGIIRDVADMTAMLAREAPALCRAHGIDMIVADQTEAAGGLVARALDLPYVSIANALPLNREPAIPPPFVGWRYDPSPWGRERNQGGTRVSDWMMRRHAGIIASHVPAWHSIADCASPLAQISQMVAGLDFPRAALPACFHYVGPLRGDASAPDFSLTRDGRPLAYASLGTLQGGRAGLFRRIAAAAVAADMQLVIAHGGRLATAEIAALPGRPAVYDFVPQAVVLREAGVAILNGGLNTVMDALAVGVPIVAIPIAFEQGAIAARLIHAGAGLRVGRGTFAGPALRRAIDTVRTEPRFGEAARGLAREIVGAGGVGRAVAIIETVLQSGRPVLREAA